MSNQRRLANEAQINDKPMQKRGVRFAYELPETARSGIAEASVSRLRFVVPATPCCLQSAGQAELHLQLADGPPGLQNMCGFKIIAHLRA